MRGITSYWRTGAIVLVQAYLKPFLYVCSACLSIVLLFDSGYNAILGKCQGGHLKKGGEKGENREG